MTAPLFILDTDFSSDIDDCGDLVVTLAYHRLGHINLLGVVQDTTRSKGPGAIRAVCIGRAQPTMPVYSYQPGSTFDPTPTAQNNWPDWVYDNFAHTGVGLTGSVTDSTTAYRTMLANAASPVTIIGTGFATALDALLQSSADGISALTGAQLIAAKVRALYWVAGIWPTTGSAEYNLAQAPSQSHDLVTNWPATVPLIFVGIEIGNTVGVTGSTLSSTQSAGDVVRGAFNQAGYAAGRTAWGQVGVMAAAEKEGLFRRVRGTASIDATTGLNSFAASSSGPHYYLTASGVTSIQAHLEELLASSATDPPLTAWAQRSFINATVT